MASMLACCALEACECAGCMACSCCASLASSALSQAARFGHVMIILLTFTFAIVLGEYYPDKLNGYSSDLARIDLTAGCSDQYTDNCMYRQLIYRASFSLFVLFGMLSLVSYASATIDKGLWMFKFVFAFVLFIGLWWGDNSFFSGYAEFARVLSFFWLLFQALLLLDFAHDCHDVLMQNAATAESEGSDAKVQYGLYLFLSLGFLVAALVGIGYLFKNYAGCEAGQAFTVITLIMGVLTTVVSMLNVVNKGLLTPCIMFAYSVFVCWYALLSENDADCNPYANDNQGPQTGASIVICVITIFIMLYCVANGTGILNIVNVKGEGVMKSAYNASATRSPKKPSSTLDQAPGQNKDLNAVLTGDKPSGSGGGDIEASGNGSGSTDNSGNSTEDTPAPERAFFHVLMTLVSLYGAMVLTAWGQANGVPNGNSQSRLSEESMWLKIVSQWVFLLLYCKVLHAAYLDREDI